ncbi:MAG: DUF2752 domain-containing protein [Planctomycetota bacterium]
MSIERRMDALLALACATALAVGAWLVPASGGVAVPGEGPARSACWFREATGIPCPTCGMTRSYVSMLEGDVAGSFRAHPAGPVMLLATAAALVGILFVTLCRRSPLWGRGGFRSSLTWTAFFVLVTGVARYFLG